MLSQNRIFPILLAALLTIAFVGASGPQLLADSGAKPNLSVTTPWARATPGGVTIGAAYLKIKSANSSDRLVGVSSPRAGRVELHSHIVEGGVMKMRKADGFDIAKDSPLVMAPGGHHIMLFDLKGPLKAGETVPLTLTFEKAGAVAVTAKVEPIGAQGPTAKEVHGSKTGDDTARGSGSEHDGH